MTAVQNIAARTLALRSTDRRPCIHTIPARKDGADWLAATVQKVCTIPELSIIAYDGSERLHAWSVNKPTKQEELR